MRFRLRSLFVVVVIASLLLACFSVVVVHPYRAEAERMEELAALGVQYETTAYHGNWLLRRIFGDGWFRRIDDVGGAPWKDNRQVFQILERCEFIQRVDLAHARNLNHDDFIALAKVQQIVYLNLARSNITDDDLASISQLNRLTHLDLYCTAITDDGMPHLAKLDALRKLDLNGTSITDKGLLQLRSLKQLECIHLRGTQVTDEGLSIVESLPQLTRVTLLLPKIEMSSMWYADFFPNTTQVSVERAAELEDSYPALNIIR